MMRSKVTIAAFATLLALSGCAQYQAVKPSETREIGGVIEVTPKNSWSRIALGEREVWTVTGAPLQSITFITGVADGEAIATKAVGSQEEPPNYRAGMRAPDVVDLFEASLISSKYSQIETSGLRPAERAGKKAFIFDFTAFDPSGLLKRGFVFATMQEDSGLSLVIFEAADEHYFDAYDEQAEAIFQSIRVI